MLQPFHIITDDFIADELRAVDGAYARPNSPWWHSAWLALRREKRQLFHIWHFLMQSNNSRGPAHTRGVTTPSKRRSLKHAAGGQKSRAHHFTRKNARARDVSPQPRDFSQILSSAEHISASHQRSLREPLQNSQTDVIYQLWVHGVIICTVQRQKYTLRFCYAVFAYQKEKRTLHYYPKLWGST